MPSSDSLDPARRTRRERVWLLLAILVLGVWVVATRLARLNDIEAQEAARLGVQVHAIESNLTQQLLGVRAALRGLRDDVAEGPVALRPRRMGRRMDALCAAIPGVRGIVLVDAAGAVVALGGAAGVAHDQAGTAWFARVQARPDPERLYVGAPETPHDGRTVLTLSVTLTDAQGRLEGAVTATLDAGYFTTLMGSMVYAPDMSTRLLHGDGELLLVMPPDPQLQGGKPTQPPSMVTRHVAAGQAASLQRGQSASGEERLVALRTLQPPALAMDKALVLSVSRSVDALRAPWRQQTELMALLYLGGSAAAVVGLLALQRRRSERDAVAAERRAVQASDAERLHLALHGGDLALWDVELPSLRATVNDRWSTMLGYEPGDKAADGSAWESLLHPDDRERVLAAQQAHLHGHTDSFEATYRMRHRDGHWIWVLDRGRVVERGSDGAPLRMVGTHLDISARVQAEETLRRGEQRSRALLAALRSGVVAHAPDGKIQEANPSAIRILGLTLDQMRGKDAVNAGWALLEEDGTPMAQARYPVNQLLAGGEPVRNLVVGRRRPDLATPVWALCSAFALRDSDGALQELVVTLYEITERKQAEEALQRSATRLRLVGRLARLGGWWLDRASGRLELSPEAAAVAETGGRLPVTLAELMPLVAPAHRAPLEAALGQAGPFDLEVEATTQRGRARILRVLGEPVRDELGRVVALQGAVQDVTESRRSQQQLLLMDTAVSQLNDMVLITEAEPLTEPGPRIVFVNDAFERLTGWRRDEVLGRSPRFLQSPASNRAELDRVRDALARHEPVRTELLNVTRSGQSYWVEVQIAPLSDATGKVTHMVAVERDITDRKRAEAAEQAAQQALAATLEAVPDLLFELDIEGTVLVYHSPRSDLLYVPAVTFLGRRVSDSLPPAASAVVMDAVREAHELGYSGGRQYELPLPGGPRWFELSISRRAAAPGELPRVIALARDVTERKQGEQERSTLERHLREAQKIESIGTLAGGIAHDFNNILPAILGNVALARQDLPADHPALQSLEQIQRAGLRARTLVQQILTFSRRQPQELVVQPLQPVLQETLSLLRATLPAAVRLDAAISDDPAPVELDATQLQQVLMNLCTNAWHALPDGRGRIEVGLAVADAATAAQLGAGDLPAGPAMHLWVSDNGSGMDADTRERCFDPFFTTKPVGQGTGLGLSVVHGIVRGHQGSISVDSTPGVGSSFHVLLPLARVATAQPGAPDTEAASAAHGQGELLWYVDDDPVMLLMVERLLEREDYRVTVYDTAVQALAHARERVRQGEAPPDLVITDYNMPELSGIELAAQLARLWPQVPVVLSSGYIADTVQAQATQAGVRALLHKEQTLEELPALVRRLLGAAPRRADGG